MMAVNSVGLVIGTLVGIKAVTMIKDQYFRKTVLTLMMIIGVATIINTLYK